MRTIYAVLLLCFVLFNCDNKSKKEEKGFTYENETTSTESEKSKQKTNAPESVTVDMSNRGIGPIQTMDISKKIDKKLAKNGKETFYKLCTACHRPDKKFIGPPVTGILDRRSPEWVMNMILNPVEMTQKDPIAKALMVEYNGAPMPNQGLSEDDARAILEYFRTLK